MTGTYSSITAATSTLNRAKTFTVVLIMFCALAFNAFAQSTGAIRGTVTDASNAVLANARVVITELSTGVVRQVNTDSAGLYSVPSLAPGNYKVQVQSPGLQTMVANNLVVTVDTTATQNFTLDVANSSQTVQVQESATLVDTSSISVGGVVNQRTVQEIPLNGRHFIDLALLIPGSVTPPANGFLDRPSKRPRLILVQLRRGP